MKHVLAMLVIALSLALAGCLSFGGGGIEDNSGGLSLEEITVKNVSITEGITVAVRGVECKFSFTTDRQTIFDEVSDCLFAYASTSTFQKNTVYSSSAQGLTSAVPIPTSTPPAIDPALVQSAENITDEILLRAELERP